MSEVVRHPAVHVTELLGQTDPIPALRDLSTAAAHLAVVMALSCCETADGRFVTWRGTLSLARRMRASESTVKRARSELFDAELYALVSGAKRWRELRTADGKIVRVKPGLVIAQLSDWSIDMWRGYVR